MNHTITRTKHDRYCTLEIKLVDGRLSICGEEGRIITPKAARKQALDYWTDFFDECPTERHAMNAKFNRSFKTSKQAAKFVLESDGEYHGLDAREVDGKIYVTESCGRTRNLLRFFPEVAPLLPWHLNDLKAACEHQEALGWGPGKTIALTNDSLTPAQRLTIEGRAMKVCEKAREKLLVERRELYRTDRNAGIKFVKAHTANRSCTIDQSNSLGYLGQPSYMTHGVTKEFERWLKEDVERDVLPEVFDAKIYKDSLCAPCPTCGYEYGTEWLKRELPAEIIKLAETVCKPAPAAPPVTMNEAPKP